MLLYNDNMKRKHVIAVLVGASLLFIIMLTFTNPTRLSSLALIAPFFLLFLILWCGSFLLLRASNFGRNRSLRLGIVLSGLPIGLLLLQSIGQLTIRDVITILVFFGVAYFYIDRIMTTKTDDI